MPMDFVGYILLACVVFVACGAAVVAFIVWLSRKVKAGREPSWREREGRRDGYVSDGDGPEVCINHPHVPPRAGQETRDFFAELDKNDRERRAS